MPLKDKAGKKPKAEKPAAAPPPRRGLQQPRTRGYRFRDHGRPQSRLSDDNLTIRLDGPQVEVVKPSFDKGSTVFRPFPMLCAEDPSKCDPPRYSADELDFTDWLRDYPVASFVGTASMKTFILYDPKDQTYERNSNPYVIFANNIINGVKKEGAGKGRWNSFVPGMSSKPKVKWPTTMYMMQGLCFQNGEKIYVLDGPPRGAGKEDKPLILQATKSVGDALIKKLDIPNPKFRGAEDDYENMFKFGDPVSFEHGRFLHIFNPDKANAAEAASAKGPQKGTWDVGKARKGEGDGGSQMSSYEVKLTRKFTVGKTVYEASLEDKADYFRKRIVWWDDVVRIPTHEELCIFIAQAFSDFPKMLEYAWADYPEFFSSDVKKIMKSRTSAQSVDVPGDEDEEDEGAEASARRRGKAASLPKGDVGVSKKRRQEDDELEDEDLEDEGLDEDEDEDLEEQEDDDVDEDEDLDDEESDDEDDEEADEDEVEDEDEDLDEDDDLEEAEEDEEEESDDEDEELDDEEEVDEDDEESDDEDEEDADEEEDEDSDDGDEEEEADEEEAEDEDDDAEEEDLDADEAAMEAATEAAEKRSSRRAGDSGKTAKTTGKAPAPKEADKKTGTKDKGKSPKSEKAPVEPPKEKGMAASKKSAKPAAKATKPAAKKSGKSKK